jgi:hypothetical protein
VPDELWTGPSPVDGRPAQFAALAPLPLAEDDDVEDELSFDDEEDVEEEDVEEDALSAALAVLRLSVR